MGGGLEKAEGLLRQLEDFYSLHTAVRPQPLRGDSLLSVFCEERLGHCSH